MGEFEQQPEDILRTDLSVGEILRRTRVHYGQTLQDIERALRIRACQIEAIERDDMSQLPGRVYAVGFVRSYAEYLGLDGERVVRLFKTQFVGGAKRPELHFPVPASDSKLPSSWVILISLVIMVVAVVMWKNAAAPDRSVVDVVPAFADIMEQQVVETNTVSETEEQNEQSAQPKIPAPKGVLLKISENSWVEIKDEAGKLVLSRVLNAGESYFVPDRPDLKMSLGNAGGVVLEIDGKDLRPLGGAGQVKRGIPLDMQFLKDNYLEAVSDVDEGKTGEHQVTP